MAFFPFSGWKESFFGDLHGQGWDAVVAVGGDGRWAVVRGDRMEGGVGDDGDDDGTSEGMEGDAALVLVEPVEAIMALRLRGAERDDGRGARRRRRLHRGRRRHGHAGAWWR